MEAQILLGEKNTTTANNTTNNTTNKIIQQ
jgi:hypothetical protein